jgi:hypothetical protein
MEDIIAIGYIIVQILVTYGVGRIVMRIVDGDWEVEESHFLYYLVGAITIIPLLAISYWIILLVN